MTATVKSASETLDRISRASRFLKRLTTLGAVVLAGFGVAFAALPSWSDPLIYNAFSDLTIATGITATKRIGLVVLMAFPLAATLFGLWHARLLFASYERGEVFTGTAASHIRLVGLAMLINAILSVGFRTLGSILLTHDNTAGSRAVSVSFSGDTFLLVLMGGLLIVIGWVTREAARLSEENRQFI